MNTEAHTLDQTTTPAAPVPHGSRGGERDFFRQTFAGSWITQGISVAAELGIADLLDGNSRTMEELAEMTQTHLESLYRLLRALASVGIFQEEAPRRFAATPLSQLLRTDTAKTQRAYARLMGMEFQAAWGQLLHSVRTGEQGFHKYFGLPFFQYLMKNPDRHAIYDSTMNIVHGSETEPILEAYDFSSFRTVVDIGGGNGSLLAALLQSHPTVRGIVFDLPSVAQRAQKNISSWNLQNRCHAEAGDFFETVPPADAYLLRHILHDWEDAEAIRILRNCQEAMGKDGKVLVAEMVIPPGNEPSFGKWLDLMMLLVGGRERTQDEYSRLFADAGLSLRRTISTRSEVSLLEAIRK